MACSRRRQLVGRRASPPRRQPPLSAGVHRARHARPCTSTPSKAASRALVRVAAIMSRRSQGSRPLAATYWVAPAQHLGLEPLTATARFSGDRLEVWAADPGARFGPRRSGRGGRRAAADVTLYPMPVGDSAGRALEADAIPLAVDLARTLKRPVQVEPFAERHPEPRPRRAGGARPDDRAARDKRFTAAWKCASPPATASGRRSTPRRNERTDRARANRARRRDSALRDRRRQHRGGAGEPPFPVGYMRGHRSAR